jgi:hypothetical protein
MQEIMWRNKLQNLLLIEVILYKCNCTNLIMISTRLYKRNVEDTKGVIRRRKSKEDRQYNDPKKKGQKDKQ